MVGKAVLVLTDLRVMVVVNTGIVVVKVVNDSASASELPSLLVSLLT